MNDTTSALFRVAALILPFALATSAAALAAENPFTVYVGTYTDGASRGIYRFTFDPATGATTEPVLAVQTPSPSFLALHPSGRFLYAVGEIDEFQGARTGMVSAFAVDPKTGDLKLLDQQPSQGTGPTHLTVDKAGRNVLVANHGGGNVVVLPIAPDGTLKPVSSNQAHRGSGPDKGRQEKPHAHGIYLDPAEHFALAPDLGADRVFVYRFDAAKGTLEPHGAGTPEPGSGPRHLAFHPNGRTVYVINELTSTITVFSWDAEKGTLTSVQTISCLPAGFSGKSWTAEVAVSPDGRFVYGSNRGDDSLAVFAVDPATGKLTASGRAGVGGKNPRHFAIDPTGRFILVGHQGSGTVGILKRDGVTGMPTLVGTPLKIDKAVCLLPVSTR